MIRWMRSAGTKTFKKMRRDGELDVFLDGTYKDILLRESASK